MLLGQKSTKNLLAKGDSYISTFTAFLGNLRSLNEEITQKDVALCAQQESIQDERDQLETARARNEKMANKIDDFLA